MLKLIMAVSADGILSLGPDDHMDWTGKEDKAIFKLLTSTNGAVVGAGMTTYNLLPYLPHRRVIPLSRNTHQYVQSNPCKKLIRSSEEPVYYGKIEKPEDKVEYIRPETLESFASKFPNAWLIGGFKVAYEALTQGLISEVYMCETAIKLFHPNNFTHLEKIPLFQRDYISSFLKNSEKWKNTQNLKFNSVTIKMWKLK